MADTTEQSRRNQNKIITIFKFCESKVKNLRVLLFFVVKTLTFFYIVKYLYINQLQLQQHKKLANKTRK